VARTNGTRTVHFIYPHGPAISCPDAIGRHVAARLSERFAIRQYDWDDVRRIEPRAGDVLLGHPHPARGTIFRRSMRRQGWARIIAFSPFNHDLAQVGFLDPVVRRCDVFLAITGAYWFERPAPLVAHWRPRMVHVDLAVDRQEFPQIKHRFAPPGARRVVYIGNATKPKNIGYLSEIARALPDTEFAWVGSSRDAPPLNRLGSLDFGTDSARELISGYDFMLTVGRADANPATVLESMAWGLVPVCTPQSGYVGLPGVPNVPLDDLATAVAVLRDLQAQPVRHLQALQEKNFAALDQHFNWDRVADQVISAIEGDVSTDIGPDSLANKMRRSIATIAGAHSPLRPEYLALTAAGLRSRSSPRGQLAAIP
jgi:glycosyltransferase involved in cell wall biosynthesis